MFLEHFLQKLYFILQIFIAENKINRNIFLLEIIKLK